MATHDAPARLGCPHPFRSLRFDGLFLGHSDGPLAQVTCLEPGCLNSMTIPVREDVARKHGGSRADGRGNSEVVMTPTMERDHV